MRTAGDKERTRRKYGLPVDATIVASFGFIHPDKMSPQALDAFARVLPQEPRALFVFVGEEADGGFVKGHAESLGLMDRVRFLGRQPASAFEELTLALDVGVNLRLPPTNGETSGSLLNLLAAGVPTIVTDVATFTDYPASVVRKVHWETAGQAGLDEAMRALVTDQAAREALGSAAWQYTHEQHAWGKIAPQYVDAIERAHRQRKDARATLHAERRPRASVSV
jgi:glycosyltransferase involved in cell wall biosynthesis